MNDDMNTMVISKTHMGYFYDIEVIMGLIYIIALLEGVHVLKFAHGQDTLGWILMLKKCFKGIWRC